MADSNFGTNRRGRTGTGAGTINFMRKLNRIWMGVVVACAIAGAAPAQDQSGTGALEFTAYVSPTAAKPEPVRNFTFYLLTKSFEDIRHEMEAKNGATDREKFIAALKLQPELKEWINMHEVLGLRMPGLAKLLRR